MGVRVNETKPDTRMAAAIVIANSFRMRPIMPPMNKTGMNTATSERVMDRMVKPISREPRIAAFMGDSPISMWRTMFSSMTIASSTTKPTDSTSAISDMLSKLKSIRYITAKVPTIDMGSARLGIIVARTFRRNRKITSTTNPSARTNVNLTSLTDSRIDSERSNRISRLTEAGICARTDGRISRMRSTT